jgi:hypothetical protein
MHNFRKLRLLVESITTPRRRAITNSGFLIVLWSRTLPTNSHVVGRAVTTLAAGIFARWAIRPPIVSRILIGSLLIVASAKLSHSLEEFEMQTTGTREPDFRIKKVSLSLLSAGIV